MRKFFFLILLIPQVSLGITQAQAQQSIQASSDLAQTAAQLLAYSQYVSGLLRQNWAFTVGYSTNTVTLSAQQQADIQATYQGLKNQLVTEFNNLP